jgi:hypothetical protein
MVPSPRSSDRPSSLRGRALQSLKNIASRSLSRRNPRFASGRLSPESRGNFLRGTPERRDSPLAREAASTSAGRRIPLWAKLAYTAFMAVLIPSYTYFYGPTNFLYFCDVALLVTLVAMWTESPLLASIAAVNVLLPQIVWCADFVGGMLGHHLTGMTRYMFVGNTSPLALFKHGLSFFHCWIPFLAFWLVWRLGYDRRALAIWTATGWAILLVCYFLMPAPPAPPDNPDLPVNINYVYNMDDAQPPQTWMPPLAWLGLLIGAYPALIWVPTHVILSKTIGPRLQEPRDRAGIESRPAGA